MSESESTKLTPTENEIFAKKFKAINDLYLSAKELKAAYYKHVRPDWSDEKIKKTVNEWMLDWRIIELDATKLGLKHEFELIKPKA